MLMEASCRLSHLSVNLSVSVCLPGKCTVAKTADRIWMPFGMMSGVSRGIDVLDGLVMSNGKRQFWCIRCVPRGRGSFMRF